MPSEFIGGEDLGKNYTGAKEDKWHSLIKFYFRDRAGHLSTVEKGEQGAQNSVDEITQFGKFSANMQAPLVNSSTCFSLQEMCSRVQGTFFYWIPVH